MNADELMQIVQNRESSVVEFKKEKVHPNSLAEEIAAFANFEGGIIPIPSAFRTCATDSSPEIRSLHLF